MKILLVNKFHYRKGGAETYYFTLADALKKAGHEVIFFSMQHEKNLPCEQSKYFVTNREYVGKTSILKKISAAKSLIYSKEAYEKMNQLIKDEKPDLAILSNIHRQLTTSIVDALYENNIKTYWVVHDLIMLCPDYQMLDSNHKICEMCANGNYSYCIKKKCVKNSLLKSYLAAKEAKYNKKHNTYAKIDKFITPSNFYRKKLIEYGFDENKVVYIPNPLPLDTKYEVSQKVDDYLLYYGRLSIEKGISTLINAMKGIDYKLIILGTGPIEDDLRKQIEDNKLSDKVFMLGFKSGDELQDYIKRAKAVVLPSEWYENGPYSAMEAMALGKPLIVSNYGGLPELVEDGVNGYIFAGTDNLILRIREIISLSQEAYDKMCNESMNIAKKKFNANIYTSRFLSL